MVTSIFSSIKVENQYFNRFEGGVTSCFLRGSFKKDLMRKKKVYKESENETLIEVT